jgi:hypothetical protein
MTTATTSRLLSESKTILQYTESVKAVAPSISPPKRIIYTINDLLLDRAQTSPDLPLVAYPASARGCDDYLHYTANSLDQFADEAARKFMELGLVPRVSNPIIPQILLTS